MIEDIEALEDLGLSSEALDVLKLSDRRCEDEGELPKPHGSEADRRMLMSLGDAASCCARKRESERERLTSKLASGGLCDGCRA